MTQHKIPFVSFVSNGVLRKICIGHDGFFFILGIIYEVEERTSYVEQVHPSVHDVGSTATPFFFRIFMEFAVAILFKCPASPSIVKICSVTVMLYWKGVNVSAHTYTTGLQTPVD
jgi:hypothetical protein